MALFWGTVASVYLLAGWTVDGGLRSAAVLLTWSLQLLRKCVFVSG